MQLKEIHWLIVRVTKSGLHIPQHINIGGKFAHRDSHSVQDVTLFADTKGATAIFDHLSVTDDYEYAIVPCRLTLETGPSL